MPACAARRHAAHHPPARLLDMPAAVTYSPRFYRVTPGSLNAAASFTSPSPTSHSAASAVGAYRTTDACMVLDTVRRIPDTPRGLTRTHCLSTAHCYKLHFWHCHAHCVPSLQRHHATQRVVSHSISRATARTISRPRTTLPAAYYTHIAFYGNYRTRNSDDKTDARAPACLHRLSITFCSCGLRTYGVRAQDA